MHIIATAEFAKIRNLVMLGSDEKPNRHAPLPIKRPAENLIRFVLSRRPQVWVSQSIPDGNARTKAKITCQKGASKPKPVRYTRGCSVREEAYPRAVPEQRAQRDTRWLPTLKVSQ